MKPILTLWILMLLSLVAGAQSQEALDKIESARIALITERLGLSPDQAEKFWPLYREYTQQRQNLRTELRDARSQLDQGRLSDDESKKLLEKGLELKERELKLDRNYSERFNKVISNRQILELRKAEQDFRRMLLDRLQQQQQKREQFQRRQQQLRNNN